MGLIKCPECGKEISEKAQACIYCGAPINVKVNKETIIKLPYFQNQNTMKKSNAKMQITNGSNVIWEGYSDENASFELEEKTNINIIIKNFKINHFFLKMLVSIMLFAVFFIGIFFMIHWVMKESTKEDLLLFNGDVQPGKRYELKNISYGANYNWKFKLSAVDVIDSD